jgi:hypothetical protein
VFYLIKTFEGGAGVNWGQRVSRGVKRLTGLSGGGGRNFGVESREGHSGIGKEKRAPIVQLQFGCNNFLGGVGLSN